jgi:hypothetical protein
LKLQSSFWNHNFTAISDFFYTIVATSLILMHSVRVFLIARKCQQKELFVFILYIEDHLLLEELSLELDV